MKIPKILAGIVKWWVYWYPFRFLVQAIPLRLNYRIVDIFVPLLYLFSFDARKRMGGGLEMMYAGKITPQVKRKIIEKTLRNIYASTVEQLWYGKMSKELCEKMFKISGLDNIDEALKEGRGVVLLHGHFGNAHLLMPSIGHRGYSLCQVGSRLPPPKAGGLLGGLLNSIAMRAHEGRIKIMESMPVRFIYTDRSMRDLLRSLKRNEVIAIGIDGREGSNEIETDFLGGRAVFYYGAMKLILKLNPVTLPVFHIRNDDNTHRILIGSPLKWKITGDAETDIKENIRSFVKMLEEKIYEYPDHYSKVFLLRQRYFLRPWSSV